MVRLESPAPSQFSLFKPSPHRETPKKPNSGFSAMAGGCFPEATSSPVPAQSIIMGAQIHLVEDAPSPHAYRVFRVFKPLPLERPGDFFLSPSPASSLGIRGESPGNTLLRYTWSFTFNLTSFGFLCLQRKLLLGAHLRIILNY